MPSGSRIKVRVGYCVGAILDKSGLLGGRVGYAHRKKDVYWKSPFSRGALLWSLTLFVLATNKVDDRFDLRNGSIKPLTARRVLSPLVACLQDVVNRQFGRANALDFPAT